MPGWHHAYEERSTLLPQDMHAVKDAAYPDVTTFGFEEAAHGKRAWERLPPHLAVPITEAAPCLVADPYAAIGSRLNQVNSPFLLQIVYPVLSVLAPQAVCAGGDPDVSAAVNIDIQNR